MTTSRSETNYTIDASYKVNVDGTSDGTQINILKMVGGINKTNMEARV